MISERVYLRDVRIVWNRWVLFWFLFLIGLGVVVGNVLSFFLSATYGLLGVLVGSIIGAIITIFGNLWLLLKQKLAKDFVVELPPEKLNSVILWKGK